MISFCSPTLSFNCVYIRAELPPGAGLRPMKLLHTHPVQSKTLLGRTAALVAAAGESRPPVPPATLSQCVPHQTTRPLQQSSRCLHPPPHPHSEHTAPPQSPEALTLPPPRPAGGNRSSHLPDALRALLPQIRPSLEAHPHLPPLRDSHPSDTTERALLLEPSRAGVKPRCHHV